ncbi:hypothetical protein D3C72_1850000 [compost metagenome]
MTHAFGTKIDLALAAKHRFSHTVQQGLRGIKGAIVPAFVALHRFAGMHFARGDDHHRPRRGDPLLSTDARALRPASKGGDNKFIMEMSRITVLVAGRPQDLHPAVEALVAPELDFIPRFSHSVYAFRP